MCAQTGTHGIGDSVVDVEPIGSQPVTESTHRGNDQVNPLDVPRSRANLADRLDHQHAVSAGVGVGQCADRTIELIAKDEDR